MRPFHVDVPQSALDDLHRRIDATRWPEQMPFTGWERGVPLGYLQELTAHWREVFDWRAVEARLNSFPQIMTTIDGADVHALHVRSPEPDAFPLVLTHGWPGSVLEFLEVLGALEAARRVLRSERAAVAVGRVGVVDAGDGRGEFLPRRLAAARESLQCAAGIAVAERDDLVAPLGTARRSERDSQRKPHVMKTSKL